MNQVNINQSQLPDEPLPKLTHSFTSKQRKYLNYIAKGLSKEEAKTLAGYSEDTNVETIEKSPNLRANLLKNLEDVGISDRYIALKIKRGLKTKKNLFFSKDGMVTDQRSIDDSDIQHKYLRDILEIRGDIKDQTMGVNLGIVMLPTIKQSDEWNDVNNVSTPNIDNTITDEK